MSSFFRSPLDVSTTAEDTSYADYSTTSQNDLTTDSDAAGGPSRQDRNEQQLQTRSHDPHFHANMMLHSLLEDKCFAEALAHFQDQGEKEREYSTDDPEVKAFAKAKYDFLSRSLSSAGVFPSGYQSEAFSSSRVNYRAGLEKLSKAQDEIEGGQGAQDSLVSELNNLLLSSSNEVDRPITALRDRAAQNYFQHDELSGRLIREGKKFHGLGSTYAQHEPTLPFELQPYFDRHSLIQHSRYQRDFAELGVLGKGGYGKVFKVQHKLDQFHYAVKKITLSPSRILRIQEGGQAELDCILTELRVLARLEHPNIVRYYGGWVEYAGSEFSITTRNERFARRKMIEDKSESYADDGIPGQNFVFGRIITQSSGGTHSNDDEVVFENSKSDKNATSSDIFASDQEASIEGIHPLPHQRRRRPSHATVSSRSKKSTVDSFGLDGEDFDEEIETVPRTADELANVTSSIFSRGENVGMDISVQNPSNIFTSDSSGSSEPKLTLHIQMSLHPLTLAEFLLPAESEDKPCHCFHTGASLRLLLAILDGVEYLHKEGVVHRDLKPTNIFLTLHEKDYHGCVDLGSCKECSESSSKNARYVQARIGDFGLVTSIACPDAVLPAGSGKAVGTEFYRPPLHFGLPTEKLDVFSLGVIAFELLYSFGTKMERHEILKDLKQAKFPDNFDSIIGLKARDVRDCLSNMLSAAEDERIQCKEVRERILAVLEELSGA